MTGPLIASLLKRRADLTKEIREAHIALERVNLDLTSLDRVIAQFDSTHKVPRRRGQGPRGSVTKALLNMIRVAPSPMTLRELAVQVVIMKG